MIWFRTYYWQFTAEFAALALSIISAFKFMLNWSQNYYQRDKMIDSLYGQMSDARMPRRDTT